MEPINVEQTHSIEKNQNGTVIFVFSGDLDRVLAALNIAIGSVSMGYPVTLFFTFWGTTVLRKTSGQSKGKLFLQKMFGWMLPKGPKALPLSRMNFLGIGPILMKILMKKFNKPGADDLLKLILQSDAKVYVCSMTMDIMGIKEEELINLPNRKLECCGIAKVLEASQKAKMTLFI